MVRNRNWRIRASTGIVGVVGDPVRHSLSPVLHNAAYRALGLDLIYCAFPVPKGHFGQALVGARALGVLGLSVTTPFKDDAARLCDERSALVERLGAANTIVLSTGVSVAESTDGAGLIADLYNAWGFDPRGRDCSVLGAGGAARAVIAALGDAGARSITVWNRTQERAVSAARLSPVGHAGSLEEACAGELVVNATSIGLGAGADDGAAFAASLSPGQFVVDLVYRPAVTPFLLAAASLRANVRNGLGMLVHQAARQVELFTNERPPIEAMWEAARAEVGTIRP
jgi:shikimate dehydrogenase